MSKMNLTKQSWFSSRFLVVIILALFFSIALYIRIHFSYDQIFSGDWIKYASNDAYYHMRLIDYLLHNFPTRLLMDTLMNYPSTSWVEMPPFFHWFLTSIIWLIGLGSPSERTVDLVAVYFPAVLGALTVVPVYFIGKELFGRWAGIISVGLISVLPGEFLGRSILGFTDHHVTETLFTTTAMMFLILAIKAARDKQITFSNFRHREWAIISKTTIYSFLAGIFLGIYLITWIGGLLFFFIISVYFIIQFIIDHLRRQSTDYLCLVGVIVFLTPLIIYVPAWHIPISIVPNYSSFPLIALIIALLIPIALSILSRQITRMGMKPVYYPLTLIGLGAVALAIFYAVSPSLLKTMMSQFSMFNPTGPITIIEMQPFLAPQGSLTLFLPWGNFSTGFFISPISLGILIALAVKRGNAEKNVLIIWSLIMLMATLGQRRFAYYLAINVALLTGYFSILLFFVVRFIIAYLRNEPARFLSWQTLESLKTPELADATPTYAPQQRMKKTREKRDHQSGFRISTHRVAIVLGAIIIFFLVFFPNIKNVPSAAQARFVPSDAWVSSLHWLRENTPDPFGDPEAYYQLHQPPPEEEVYKYPETAYGVTAWGDYGNWILRIAHRLPNRPPGPGGERIATFFTSQDEESAQKMADLLDTRYVIIDHETALDKFWALAQWADRQMSEFFDIYYLREEGVVKSITLFYPEYYRSMVARLYNFDGKAVTPIESIVISYEERKTQEGETAKLITSIESFPSYEEASAYVSSQNSISYRIVGSSPFVSPVPLEALEHYKLIHSSDGMVTQSGTTLPKVKIFKYVE